MTRFLSDGVRERGRFQYQQQSFIRLYRRLLDYAGKKGHTVTLRDVFGHNGPSVDKLTASALKRKQKHIEYVSRYLTDKNRQKASVQVLGPVAQSRTTDAEPAVAVKAGAGLSLGAIWKKIKAKLRVPDSSSPRTFSDVVRTVRSREAADRPAHPEPIPVLQQKTASIRKKGPVEKSRIPVTREQQQQKKESMPKSREQQERLKQILEQEIERDKRIIL